MPVDLVCFSPGVANQWEQAFKDFGASSFARSAVDDQVVQVKLLPPNSMPKWLEEEEEEPGTIDSSCSVAGDDGTIAADKERWRMSATGPQMACNILQDAREPAHHPLENSHK